MEETRFTISLSEEGKENLKRAQEILSKEFGGGRVTQGMALAYILKNL